MKNAIAPPILISASPTKQQAIDIYSTTIDNLPGDRPAGFRVIVIAAAVDKDGLVHRLVLTGYATALSHAIDVTKADRP